MKIVSLVMILILTGKRSRACSVCGTGQAPHYFFPYDLTNKTGGRRRCDIKCNGPSMEPTLFSNNILLTERITTRFHKPNRGDIIIAVSPTNPEQYICKRVVGLPGDKVILDKAPPELSEIKEGGETIITSITEDYVPKGFIWIEGDNQRNSADSRYYGPIPLGLVKSRAICRIWPLKEVTLL